MHTQTMKFLGTVAIIVILLMTAGCAVQNGHGEAGMMGKSDFIAVPRNYVEDNSLFGGSTQYRNCSYSQRDDMYYCRR